MKASQIKESLKALTSSRLSTFIWGAPGVGKSQLVSQVASELKVGFTDVRAVLLDPVDLRGLPHINGDNKAHWCAPDFLPTKGKGILFLDELNAAPPLVQAACYQLVLPPHKLGEYQLPEGWSVVAAGNRETDRAVTHRMPSALANRFIHIDFDVDLEEWVMWALNNNIVTELIAFLRYRPALLHSFDPKKNEKSFPSPRAWEFVSKVVSSKMSPALEHEIVKGTVGEAAAAEFIGFLRIFRNLTSPDLILLKPETIEVPKDAAVLYALCGALSRKASEQNFDRLVKFFNRMPAEFSVLAVRDSILNDSNIVNTRAYVEWSSKNSKYQI
jgi:MoxR-like ATPase